MSMLLTITLFALVAAGVFFLLRRPKGPPDKRSDKAAAGHEHRIRGDRRSGLDKREDIRFEPDKSPRRSGEGRRQQDNLWKKDD